MPTSADDLVYALSALMMLLAMDKETKASYNKSRLKIREHEAHLNYHVELFGDHIAKREAYRRNLDGIRAVHFYLIHKFGWLPRDVLSMSMEDVRLVLDQEMEEWSAQKSQKVIQKTIGDGLQNARDRLQKDFNDDRTEETT
jgi:hypothetical protein